MSRPSAKPRVPNFSSGPCAKYPGFTMGLLEPALVGRSHRSTAGKARIQESLARTRDILQLPDGHLVGIVPGSDTGAVEMALWNLLGPRGVDAVAFDSFGRAWASDIKAQLGIQDATYHFADYGQLPDLAAVNFEHDVVLTWNGTTSGVRVPDGAWIPSTRQGLTIVDATSAVFAMDVPWDKVDVCTFSWQKALGGEGAHGMLVLSPRAIERIESYVPRWPLPKLFNLRKGKALNREIFEGSPINTPSMLCVEDYLSALRWAERIGGLQGLIARSRRNLAAIERFVEGHDWIRFLAAREEIRSNTAVCLLLGVEPERVAEIVRILEREAVAYDCESYREAPPGLRFWCGSTVETEDVEALLEWLAWAYDRVRSGAAG